MSGRYSVNDIMGRCYWRTDDMRDAFVEARAVSGLADLAIVRDEVTSRTVYMKSGRVSVYVTPSGADVDRVSARRTA